MEVCQLAKNCGRYVNITAFIVAVHALTARKNNSHLDLSQIFVLSQVPNPAVMRHIYTLVLFGDSSIIPYSCFPY